FHVSFFFQAEDGIRDRTVTGVQTCALPICEEDRKPRPDRHPGRVGEEALRRIEHRAPGRRGRLLAEAEERKRGLRDNRGRNRKRSEERRVGKECRSRWWAYGEKKKERSNKL